MAENANLNETQNVIKKERFEFVLTINGNIVCQRYFRMFNYNNEAACSVEAVDAVDECVRIIDNDLKEKTRIFLEETAPRIFNTIEDANEWHKNASVREVSNTTFVIIKDGGEEYGKNYVCRCVDDGFEPWNGRFNTADYVSVNENEPETVLEFSIYDNGNALNRHTRIASKIWDGNVYPRFIRNNIDLSNQKNKYNGSVDGVFYWFESNVVDRLINGRSDLVPTIIATICNWFSNPLEIEGNEASEDGKYHYNTIVNYSDRTYNLDRKTSNRKYFRNLGNSLTKETNKYFETLYV